MGIKIKQIDGLNTTLGDKVNVSGDTMTGNLGIGVDEPTGSTRLHLYSESAGISDIQVLESDVIFDGGVRDVYKNSLGDIGGIKSIPAGNDETLDQAITSLVEVEDNKWLAKNGDQSRAPRVGYSYSFNGVNNYLNTGVKIQGQTPIHFKFNYTYEGDVYIIGGDGAPNAANKQILCKSTSTSIIFWNSNGSALQRTTIPTTQSIGDNNEIIIEWDGMTGGNIDITLNGDISRTVATNSWTGDATYITQIGIIAGSSFGRLGLKCLEIGINNNPIDVYNMEEEDGAIAYSTTTGKVLSINGANIHVEDTTKTYSKANDVGYTKGQNLLKYSEDFTFWYNNTLIVTDNENDPFGGSDAFKVENVGITPMLNYGSLFTGTDSRKSRIWVKGNTGETVHIGGFNGASPLHTFSGNWELVETITTNGVSSNVNAYIVDFRGTTTATEVLIYHPQFYTDDNTVYVKTNNEPLEEVIIPIDPNTGLDVLGNEPTFKGEVAYNGELGNYPAVIFNNIDNQIDLGVTGLTVTDYVSESGVTPIITGQYLLTDVAGWVAYVELSNGIFIPFSERFGNTVYDVNSNTPFQVLGAEADWGFQKVYNYSLNEGFSNNQVICDNEPGSGNYVIDYRDYIVGATNYYAGYNTINPISGTRDRKLYSESVPTNGSAYVYFRDVLRDNNIESAPFNLKFKIRNNNENSITLNRISVGGGGYITTFNKVIGPHETAQINYDLIPLADYPHIIIYFSSNSVWDLQFDDFLITSHLNIPASQSNEGEDVLGGVLTNPASKLGDTTVGLNDDGTTLTFPLAPALIGADIDNYLFSTGGTANILTFEDLPENFNDYIYTNIVTDVSKKQLTITSSPLKSFGDLILQTANEGVLSDKIVIKYDGKVGIATDTPNYKLDVNGDVGISSGLTLSFLTASTESEVLVTDVNGNITKNNINTLINNSELIIDVTGSTYVLDETINYSEVLLHITTGSTITINTSQLSKDSTLRFKSAGNYNITIQTEGSEMIDNNISQVISGYDSMVIYPRDLNWWIK